MLVLPLSLVIMIVIKVAVGMMSARAWQQPHEESAARRREGELQSPQCCRRCACAVVGCTVVTVDPSLRSRALHTYRDASSACSVTAGIACSGWGWEWREAHAAVTVSCT